VPLEVDLVTDAAPTPDRVTLTLAPVIGSPEACSVILPEIVPV